MTAVIKMFLTVLVLLMLPVHAFAAHPLITDDAGTLGKGGSQLEINTEVSCDREKENGIIIKEQGGEIAAILTHGMMENMDIVLGVPYQWLKVREDYDVTDDKDGLSDISLEMKWRFFENEGFAFALKPGITVPTGNEDKGLGNGRFSYSLTLISTKEIKDWAFHLNLAYMRNAYQLQEDRDANRKYLWHVSVAAEKGLTESMTAVANIGTERNPDKTSSIHPAFALAGIVYSVTDNLNVDAGIKAGLNKPETDFTLLAGMAIVF